MSQTRAKIEAALKKQEEIEGPSEGIELLRRILPQLKYGSQWAAISDCKFHTFRPGYGGSHKFYYPSHLVGIIAKAMTPPTPYHLQIIKGLYEHWSLSGDDPDNQWAKQAEALLDQTNIEQTS